MTCRRRCGFFLQSFSRPQTSDCDLPVGAWWPFIQRPQLCLWGSQAWVDKGPTLLQSHALLWAL